MPVTLGDDHLRLMDQLDVSAIDRPFRRKNWKPPQRRNKNVAQIISETARRELSMQATQNNSGSSTPAALPSGGIHTPTDATNGERNGVDLRQASRDLSRLNVEGHVTRNPGSGPVSNYVSIESAPSLHPAQQQHYCDITGLPGPYTDPKTRLRYHNKELFSVVRGLTQGEVERYLEVRGAQAVLK